MHFTLSKLFAFVAAAQAMGMATAANVGSGAANVDVGIACINNNLGGTCGDLNLNALPSVCVNVTPQFNDNISSFRLNSGVRCVFYKYSAIISVNPWDADGLGYRDGACTGSSRSFTGTTNDLFGDALQDNISAYQCFLPHVLNGVGRPWHEDILGMVAVRVVERPQGGRGRGQPNCGVFKKFVIVRKELARGDQEKNNRVFKLIARPRIERAHTSNWIELKDLHCDQSPQMGEGNVTLQTRNQRDQVVNEGDGERNTPGRQLHGPIPNRTARMGTTGIKGSPLKHEVDGFREGTKGKRSLMFSSKVHIHTWPLETKLWRRWSRKGIALSFNRGSLEHQLLTDRFEYSERRVVTVADAWEARSSRWMLRSCERREQIMGKWQWETSNALKIEVGRIFKRMSYYGVESSPHSYRLVFLGVLIHRAPTFRISAAEVNPRGIDFPTGSGWIHQPDRMRDPDEPISDRIPSASIYSPVLVSPLVHTFNPSPATNPPNPQIKSSQHHQKLSNSMSAIADPKNGRLIGIARVKVIYSGTVALLPCEFPCTILSRMPEPLFEQLINTSREYASSAEPGTYTYRPTRLIS
ncbi:hypothetical protein C8R43DRAFT_946077 [Mycena crocata]|nr:hypothetical protein C8R43DRAFT_946077 [Mycena crocata]